MLVFATHSSVARVREGAHASVRENLVLEVANDTVGAHAPPRAAPRADVADQAHYADDRRRKRHDALVKALHDHEEWMSKLETAHPRASPPPPASDLHEAGRRSLQNSQPRGPPSPPQPPAAPTQPAEPPPPPPFEWAAERAALIALYEATGGSRWRVRTNWLSGCES
eukprot:6296454-Prymnesium_polylepis.1